MFHSSWKACQFKLILPSLKWLWRYAPDGMESFKEIACNSSIRCCRRTYLGSDHSTRWISSKLKLYLIALSQIVLDHGGPRAYSVHSNAVVVLGTYYSVLLGNLRPLPLVSPWSPLGPEVQTSLIRTGSLFPEKRFFVIERVAESITFSFAAFVFMDVLFYMTPLTFRGFFLGLGVMLGASRVCCAMLWPDQPYKVIEVRTLKEKLSVVDGRKGMGAGAICWANRRHGKSS